MTGMLPTDHRIVEIRFLYVIAGTGRHEHGMLLGCPVVEPYLGFPDVIGHIGQICAIRAPFHPAVLLELFEFCFYRRVQWQWFKAVDFVLIPFLVKGKAIGSNLLERDTQDKQKSLFRRFVDPCQV